MHVPNEHVSFLVREPNMLQVIRILGLDKSFPDLPRIEVVPWSQIECRAIVVFYQELGAIPSIIDSFRCLVRSQSHRSENPTDRRLRIIGDTPGLEPIRMFACNFVWVAFLLELPVLRSSDEPDVCDLFL